MTIPPGQMRKYLLIGLEPEPPAAKNKGAAVIAVVSPVAGRVVTPRRREMDRIRKTGKQEAMKIPAVKSRI